jgi:RNA polymerase sigma-70 factor (family 1)
MTEDLPLDPSDFSASSGPRIEVFCEKDTDTFRKDDAELLIRKTFDSDPRKGCELLFRLYYRALCTHAARFVYSREVAEDIVSEVFYAFWSMHAYRSVTTSYRAYLFRSVRNRSYNYLSNDLRKSDPLTAAGQPEVPESDSPERILQLDELLTSLNQLIASLPPQCQKVFVMNRFEGRRSREIAEELQLSPRTVETHIFKALSVLKSGLKNQWPWMALLLIFN